MNPIQKVFCRTFQLAFHAALPILPYREPKLFHAIDELEPALKDLGIKSALLVTDSVLKSSGATERLEQLLCKCGIQCAVYDQTRPNPTVHNVEDALALYKKAGCQCLIAFGGGSSMDCAKAVGTRVAYPKKTLNQMKGNLRVFRKLPALIAIPTTAGTGSDDYCRHHGQRQQAQVHHEQFHVYSDLCRS